MRTRTCWWFIGLLLLGGAPPAAWSAEPFDAVPAGHWSYAAVRELAADGYFTGLPDAALAAEGRLTRYEFAIAVARLLRHLELRADEATQTPDRGGRPLASLRRDLETIQRLAREFAAELAATGIDADQIRAHARRLQERLRRAERLPSPPTLEPAPAAEPEPRLPAFRALARELQSQFRGPARPESPLPAIETFASDPLHLPREALPLTPEEAQLALLAQIRFSLGRYGISTYYRRIGEGYLPPASGLSFQALEALRGLQGVGTTVTAPLRPGLALNLEGAIFSNLPSTQDSSARYFRGGLRWALSDRLLLDLTYERLISAGLGNAAADAVYEIGLMRQLGQHTSVGILYQYHRRRIGFEDGLAPLDATRHTAMTRLTVRF